jgi:hypothetical protein
VQQCPQLRLAPEAQVYALVKFDYVPLNQIIPFGRIEIFADTLWAPIAYTLNLCIIKN